MSSLIESLARKLGPENLAASMSPEEWEILRYEWTAWARTEQLAPPSPWSIWLVLAGRGFGKTRLGAEWVRNFAFENPGCRIALIARTAADIRTTMLEGPSGLLSISPPWFFPDHNPSKAKLVWPNGSVALHFSAEEPKGLRGPQFSAAWADELAAWPTVNTEDGEAGIPGAWTQLEFGMRIPGRAPQVVVTTTPRPTKIIRELVKRSRDDKGVIVTRGSTFDNRANLAAEFLERIKDRYASTRIGRQEIFGELLDDVPGALWTRANIDELRVDKHPDLARVVVAVDPSGGHTEDNDEQGIVVVGLGVDGHAYVLSDRTCRLSPDGWGRRAIVAYGDYSADRIVYEQNYGGEMCEHVLATAAKAAGVRVATKMLHASRGKVQRAEPVAALYEQGRVHHVGAFDALEDEQCTFTPLGFDGSPNRVDALVWAVTELMLHEPVSIDGEIVTGHRRGVTKVDEPEETEQDDDEWDND